MRFEIKKKLMLTPLGADTLDGANGADYLEGNDGSDSLNGGSDDADSDGVNLFKRKAA